MITTTGTGTDTFATALAAVFYGAYPAHMTAIRQHPMTFNAPINTLDVLLPIVDLGQQDSWQPAGIALYVYWALIIPGWVPTSAFAAGITGIFRRD
jgi:hypothetical protein